MEASQTSWSNDLASHKPADEDGVGPKIESQGRLAPGRRGNAYRGPEKIFWKRGHITAEQLEAAAAEQKGNPRLSLLETLVRSKAIDDMVALEAVADYFKLPFMRAKTADVDPMVYALLPANYKTSKRVLPIRRDEDVVVLGHIRPS